MLLVFVPYYGDNDILKLPVLLLYVISIPLLLNESALFFIYHLLHPFSTISFNLAVDEGSVFSRCIGLIRHVCIQRLN